MWKKGKKRKAKIENEETYAKSFKGKFKFL